MRHHFKLRHYLAVLFLASGCIAISQTLCNTDQAHDAWCEQSFAIATAIRSYELDNAWFPPSTGGADPTISDIVTSYPVAGSYELIVYMSAPSFQDNIQDPFTTGSRLGYSAKDYGWILASTGPDRQRDINVQNDYIPWDVDSFTAILAKTYDATNGCFSQGDLWISEEYLDYRYLYGPGLGQFIGYLRERERNRLKMQ